MAQSPIFGPSSSKSNLLELPQFATLSTEQKASLNSALSSASVSVDLVSRLSGFVSTGSIDPNQLISLIQRGMPLEKALSTLTSKA